MFTLFWFAGCTVLPDQSSAPAEPAVRFRHGEVTVRGRWPGAAEMGLSLVAVGDRVSPAVQPSTDGDRTTYARPGVLEWWEPTLAGMEQGFVVDEVPEVGPLVLELALRGARATVGSDGRSATFAVAGGGRVRYTGLRAWDAEGVDLPSFMEATGDGLRLVVDTDGAVAPVTIDPVIPDPVWTATGDRDYSSFGTAVSSTGDLNGDGFDDLVVGEPYRTVGGREEGSVSVFFGSAAGLAAVPGWRANSGQSFPGSDGPRFGATLATSDLDGDGFDDLIVGAPTWVTANLPRGAVHVYHGSAAGLPATPDTILEGTAADQASFSHHLSALGDVTGDGFGDVLIASNGRVGVFPGSPTGLLSTPSWTLPGWAYTGPPGDFDGDGLLDVVVTRSDTVEVYPGTAGGPASAPAWSMTEPQGELFGSVLAAVDLNGDGYDDLAIGDPWFDAAELRAGKVTLYLGSPTGLATVPTWTGTGTGEWAQFGSALSGAGDLNGDGLAELWVGVEGADTGLGTGPGRVELYLGSPSGVESAVGWWVEALGRNSAFGSVLDGGGDLDGDGRTDLVVGAPTADFNTGEVALWPGAAIDVSDVDGDGVTGALDDCPEAADPQQVDGDGDGLGDACDRPQLSVPNLVSRGLPTTLTASGVLPGELVGFAGAGGPGGAGPCPAQLGGLCLDLGPGALELGRVVADAAGVARLEVTVPLAITVSGVVSVQAVVVRGPGGVDSADSPVVTLDGDRLDWDADGLSDSAELAAGTEPTLADTDGDWLEDGEELPRFDPLVDDTDGDGELDGFDRCWLGDDFGPDQDGDEVPDLCDLCRAVADPEQLDTDGDGLGDRCEGEVLAESETMGINSVHWSYFGDAVASGGDVNGDGYDDLVVGAPGNYTESVGGRAYLYLGSAVGLTGQQAWVQAGQRRFEGGFGDAVAFAGDTNGDGYDDVLVGEPYGSFYDLHTPSASLFLGSAGGLANQAAWTQSKAADELWGDWVASAGDVDGDGYADVLVGNGRDRLELYLGSAAGLVSPAAWTSNVWARGGSAGDVNGDGLEDLWFDDGFAETAVFLGGRGLQGDPWWSATLRGPRAAVGDVDGDGYADLVAAGALQLGGPTGLEAGDEIPTDLVVAAAGDVNGDGYADVVLGDDQYRNGEAGEGGAFLFLGSPMGLAAAPAWVGESDASQYSELNSYNGWIQEIGYGSALSSGDLNGDGLSDVVVGAPYYDGDTQWGAVFSYLGEVP